MNIFDILSDGIISFDAKLQIIYINEKAAAFLQCERNFVCGKKLSSLPKTKLLEKCVLLLAKAKESKALEKDVCDFQKPFVLTAFPSPLTLVLQEKIDLCKEFIDNASHELRTPITIIQGFAETLQQMDLSKEMVITLTDKIIKTTNRISTLVSNLLVLSDVEASSLALRPVHLFSFLENCKKILTHLHPEVHILIDFSCDCILLADEGLLEVAILNLLKNAVKYAQTIVEINIRLTHLKQQVRLDIADNGMGIPEKDIEHIFDRFYKVNKEYSRKIGGVGLGLSIVKSIMEKHKGSVTVFSTLGKGSTFSLFFPYSK